MKAVVNGRLVLPNKILDNHILFFDEHIVDIKPVNEMPIDETIEIIDGKNNFVAPGFINEHIHGILGSDAMDGTEKALTTMATALPKTGVTSFLATTMTATFIDTNKALEAIKSMKDKRVGAKVLGVHLEGPFISRKYKGAQVEKNIALPDFLKIDKYKDVIKIVTFAPEEVESLDFFTECKNNEILLSMGHSAVSYDVAMAAIIEGASRTTHLFNAMSPFHHRNPGLVGATLDSHITAEIICDNIHVHPMLQRLVYKVKGKSEIVLVTDSMRGALLGEGVTELGGQKVLVKNKEARLEDGTLAGSILTMNEAVKNFMNNTHAPLEEVVGMVTINPAKELKIYDKVGSLEQGKIADITIFDKDLDIKQTFVEGKSAFVK